MGGTEFNSTTEVTLVFIVRFFKTLPDCIKWQENLKKGRNKERNKHERKRSKVKEHSMQCIFRETNALWRKAAVLETLLLRYTTIPLSISAITLFYQLHRLLRNAWDKKMNTYYKALKATSYTPESVWRDLVDSKGRLSRDSQRRVRPEHKSHVATNATLPGDTVMSTAHCLRYT